MTLVVIPLLISAIWIIELYLLVADPGLLFHYDPAGIVLYTLLASIAVGIAIPLIRIRVAFMSGDVNMFQIGFCPARRTIPLVIITLAAAYSVLWLVSPSFEIRAGIVGSALVLLPTAIAAVMICWAYYGTHIQAYVRSGGIIVSVSTGVILTALVFAITMTVFFPGIAARETFLAYLLLGAVAALFFFAAREIYSTVILVCAGLSHIIGPSLDPVYLSFSSPAGILCGLFSLAVLVGVHIWLSLHYTTILVGKTGKPAP
jgi:hypothetical protein